MTYYVNGKEVSKEEYDKVRASMKVFPSSGASGSGTASNSAKVPLVKERDTDSGLLAADDPEAQVFIPDSPQIQNKTVKPSTETSNNSSSASKGSTFADQSKQQVVQSGETNVLNGYRSSTYNFTLAGLRKSYLDDPDELRKSELDLVILRSGGKGTNGISSAGAYGSTEIIAGFNANSPGRFDMFIEDVEIESIMAFSNTSNTSLPTKIKFQVIEPYSINGFIESLYVASLAAGYTNYISASYVLKVEFKGYPDGDSISDPEVVPNSTRYFPIGITNIEVEVTEKGTVYRVDAVPYNERSFGQSNVIKKPIKMEGQTVKAILENFFDNVNKQNVAIWKETYKNAKDDQVDMYEIKFPNWSDSEGWQYDIDNAISKAKLIELYKDNALYNLINPAGNDVPNGYKTDGSKKAKPEVSTQPEKIKYNPTSTVVQFSEGMNIHDVISVVIRDSEYVRNILKDVKSHTDAYGMVNYFMIRIETRNTDVINEVSKKPVQKLTFVVTPYKIHYSKIPNLADNIIHESELKKLSLREYNYIYTGQNVDVLSFKLNFNSLFFEAIPVAMGNKDVPEAKTGAGNSNNVKVTQASPPTEIAKQSQVPLPPKKPVPTPVQSYSGNASQQLDDPYSTLARSLHESVVNSKASMLSGELEILGDPFYLTTGGLGNFNPKPSARGKNSEGEANQNYGQLMITINFRNPIDIQSLEQGGAMYFDSNRVPFSGVYMVTQVNHSFKDGIFKQRLAVIRMPGQVIEYNIRPTNFAALMSTEPSPGDQVVSTNANVPRYSQRLDSTTAFEQIQRGLPTPGLPGVASNFVAAAGGIGTTAAALMNQTNGIGNALSAASSVIGQTLPTDAISNLRLNASGLSKISLGNLNSAALTNAAVNVITGNVPFKQAAGTIAGQILGSTLASAIKKSNVGSGIGEGATVSVDPMNITDPTALDLKFGNTIDSTSLPTGSLSNIGESIKDLGSSALSAISNLGDSASEFVGNVGEKLRSLNATPADPEAISAAAGLDSSKLSGLDPAYQSKVNSQLKSMIASIPSDVNLDQAVSQGLVLDYIPSGAVKNIPAISPYSIAPEPDVPNPVIPTVSFNPYDNASKSVSLADSSIIKDKFESATKQLSAITGQPIIQDKNLTGSVLGKYGSGSSNPLDKLVNKLNDPNAPPYTGDDPIIRARLGLPPLNNG